MAKKRYDQEELDAIPTPARNSDLRGLSWPELKYLKDCGKLTAEQQRKAGFRPRRGEGGTFPPGEEPQGEYDEEDEDEDEADESYVSEEGEEGEQPEDYAEWTKQELQDEVDERNKHRDTETQLLKSGNVGEIRKRLIADDATQAEAEES